MIRTNDGGRTLRLSTLAPDAVKRLRAMTEHQRRETVAAACDYALERTGLKSALLDSARERLHSHQPLSAEQRTALESLAADLDNRYFDLQESALEGTNGSDEAAHFFSQARAISALLFAFDSDSLTASTEALYEAAMSGDDPVQVLAQLDLTPARGESFDG